MASHSNPDQPNPVLAYEAPAFAPGQTGFGRLGNLLEVKRSAVLPERCIKCNGPAIEQALVFELKWVDPTIKQQYKEYRFIPVANSIVAIKRGLEILENTKSVIIQLPLCRRHRRQRLHGRWIQWVLLLLAIASVFPAIAFGLSSKPLYGWIGAALAIVALLSTVGCIAVTALLAEPPARIMRMDTTSITLAGVGIPFLESISNTVPPSRAQSVAETKALTERLAQARRRS